MGNRKQLTAFTLGIVLAAGVWGLISFFSDEVGGGSVPAALSAFEFADGHQLVPHTPFVDEAGEMLTIQDFEGKVLVVNVWATWCGPCLEEMPTLDRLRAKVASDTIDVLAISVDREGVPIVREYYDDLGVEHLAVYNDEAMKLNIEWEAFNLPTTIVVGAQGQEIGRLIGTAEWDGAEIISFLDDLSTTDKIN